MQWCDPRARSSIQSDLSVLEKRWVAMDESLNFSIGVLESAVELWKETESNMNEILDRLKDVRLSLQKPLSSNYDELEMELRNCKVGISIFNI